MRDVYEDKPLAQYVVDRECTDLWDHVFKMLDAYPELTGNDAGYVATQVEKAFIHALVEIENGRPGR